MNVHACNAPTEEQRLGDLWSLQTTQSSQLINSRFKKGLCLKEIWRGGDKRRHIILTLSS